MREILVIRFGALGDLCVLGWALSRLLDSHAPGACRVTLVTKAAFAPLMAQVRGVDEVIALEGSDFAAVSQLAATVRLRQFDIIVDAHNILRSHLLLALLRRRPHARLAKDTAARLGFMAFGLRNDHLKQSMRDRFDALLSKACAPDFATTNTPPLIRCRPAAASETTTHAPPVIGLAPGAQWDTKRWPEANFARLMQLFREQFDGQVKVYLGPREQMWFAGSTLAAAVAADSKAEIIQVPDLTEVARSLGSTDILVTNDSGLLHVAEAVGTRVLAFFGPTVREFGYFPLQTGSQVLETDVECRPCSRNGKRPCRRNDLICLTRISPELAFEALVRMLLTDKTS